MKKLSIALFAGLLTFSACDNPNSSSVGDWSKEESKNEREEVHAINEHEGTTEEKGGDTTKSLENAGGVNAESLTDSSATKPE